MVNNIINMFKEYASAISALCALSALIGGLIAKLINFHKNKTSIKQNRVKELEEENQELKAKVKDLEKSKEIDDELIINNQGDCLYWQKKKIYICPVCWYSDRKIVPVSDNGDGKYTCIKCSRTGIFNKANMPQKFDISSVIQKFHNHDEELPPECHIDDKF